MASDGGVTATSGPTITAAAVYAVGAISATGGATVRSSPGAGQLFPNSSAPVDPYASGGVFSRLPAVAALTAPIFPSVGSAPSGGGAQTCTTASSTLTLGPGTYGTVSTTYYPSCVTINFTGGVGTETDITGGLVLNGGGVTVNFGPGTYKINNGITTGGSTPITFTMTGTPTIDIWPGGNANGIAISGSSSLTVNGSANYYVLGGIINNSGGAVTFANTNSGTPSSFHVAGGISVPNGPVTFPDGIYTITSGDSGTGAAIDGGGGATATFGKGGFDIAGGIYIGGGGKLTLGGQLNSDSVFEIPTVDNNKYAIQTSGGSALTLGGFANFDINGPVLLAGNVTLGGGTYSINGLLDASTSGGNAITGTGVSIVTSGAISFGAGYSTISLSAPATITSATLGTAATVVLASNSAAGSSISAGASNTNVVGALYLPNASLSLSGAGNLTGGGGCLAAVSSGIALSGSGTISTDCPSLGNSATPASVALVQ